jgi:hypothetical protein
MLLASSLDGPQIRVPWNLIPSIGLKPRFRVDFFKHIYCTNHALIHYEEESMKAIFRGLDVRVMGWELRALHPSMVSQTEQKSGNPWQNAHLIHVLVDFCSRMTVVRLGRAHSTLNHGLVDFCSV